MRIIKQILAGSMVLFSALTGYGQSYEDVLENRKVTVNHPDHTVVAYLKPVKSVSTESKRTYSWFSGNQIRTTQGGYSGRLLNGLYEDFYLDKNLKETGYFAKGLKQGLWKSWNVEGVLKEELNWDKGQKTGDYAKYSEAGVMLEKGVYKNGLRNGNYEKYTEAGVLAEKSEYNDDLLNGKQQLFTGLKTAKGADSVKVVYYKNGKVVQPKPFLPKIGVPGFIKKSFTKKSKN